MPRPRLRKARFKMKTQNSELQISIHRSFFSLGDEVTTSQGDVVFF